MILLLRDSELCLPLHLQQVINSSSSSSSPPLLVGDRGPHMQIRGVGRTVLLSRGLDCVGAATASCTYLFRMIRACMILINSSPPSRRQRSCLPLRNDQITLLPSQRWPAHACHHPKGTWPAPCTPTRPLGVHGQDKSSAIAQRSCAADKTRVGESASRRFHVVSI